MLRIHISSPWSTSITSFNLILSFDLGRLDCFVFYYGTVKQKERLENNKFKLKNNYWMLEDLLRHHNLDLSDRQCHFQWQLR